MRLMTLKALETWCNGRLYLAASDPLISSQESPGLLVIQGYYV